MTVLLLLLKGTPSMVRAAFAPPNGVLKVSEVLLFTTEANAPVLPELWLCRDKREPLASLTTLAAIPQLFAEL